MICGGFKEVLGGFVASRGAEQDYDLSLSGVACTELDLDSWKLFTQRNGSGYLFEPCLNYNL